ncbi:rRNA adenine n(6)-methyltransferase [Plakobranchus ocellatus]|uniref:rRNA adenine n(6)-methyltransferase n=1 Tax=Plakobranchus ocellatus TaxID=259542 RepID=A0AAV4AXG7_9GAST|nr:rRNA adenine n(6)-methyltransferase [Plakobranchus ocellatus]
MAGLHKSRCVISGIIKGKKSLIQSQLTYHQYQQYARISRWAQQCQSRISADSAELSKPKLRSKDGRHAADRATAERLVQTILRHRTDPTAPVIHAEAGSRLVCEEFLKQGVSSVIALDSSKHLSPDYQVLQAKYGPDRFQSIHWPMLSLRLKLGVSSGVDAASGDRQGKSSYSRSEAHVLYFLQQHTNPDAASGDRQGKSSYSRSEAHVLHFLQQHTNPGSSHAILNIGGKAKNEHYDFLFYILRNLPTDDPIISQAGVEFFFLAHPRFKLKQEFLANIETASYSTRYSSIIAAAYLLYEIKFIGQFDADAFVPPFKTTKAAQDPDWVDPHVRLLVKLRLKPNIESILPLDQHVPFFIFLRQLYMKQVNRVIPTMEMLVPGCGLRMLALDFTMMDMIIRTQPERLLLLYRHMTEWPEYQLSPLRNFILQKTRGGIDHWPESDSVKEKKGEQLIAEEE